MVKTIQPNENSSSVCTTPTPRKSPSKRDEFDNQFLYTPTASQQTSKTLPTINNSVDAKMTAQHREIERLVDSRQRLHTIKDQIASLHESMTTPPIQSKKDLTNEAKTYEDKLNDSRNIRPTYRFNRQDDNESELYGFEGESEDGEETDEDANDHPQINQQTQSRIKQSVGRTII
jgi:hypothetical protein